jgi:hypothetical protein
MELSHHVPASEIHSLARASHIPVRGCPKETRLVSTKMEDDKEHDGLEMEEDRSSFNKFDPRSLTNPSEDMMKDAYGQ